VNSAAVQGSGAAAGGVAQTTSSTDGNDGNDGWVKIYLDSDGNTAPNTHCP